MNSRSSRRSWSTVRSGIGSLKRAAGEGMRVAIVEAVGVVGLWCVVCVRYLEGESVEV